MAVYRVGEVDDLGVDVSSITSYIQREWNRPIALTLPRFYDWQFRRSPDGAGKNRCVVIVDESGELFAFMGVTNREFHLDGKTLLGADLTTWVVSDELRGLGYGRRIIEYLQAQYEVIVGMGITDSALPIYATLGFRFINHVPRYVRIFDLDAVKPISDISPLGERVVQQYARIPEMSYRSRRVDFPEVGELASTLHRDFHCLSRGLEHLKWRYAEHPVFHYETFLVESDGKAAAVVLRADQKDAVKFVHVIDVFGEESVLPCVVHFLDSYCRETDVDFSDFYCMADRIGHVFWHYGWFSVLDDRYIQVPHLFYPIELRTPPTTSMILWAKYDMCSLIDRSRLYITKGDCDLDRPTLDYLHEKGQTL